MCIQTHCCHIVHLYFLSMHKGPLELACIISTLEACCGQIQSPTLHKWENRYSISWLDYCESSGTERQLNGHWRIINCMESWSLQKCFFLNQVKKPHTNCAWYLFDLQLDKLVCFIFAAYRLVQTSNILLGRLCRKLACQTDCQNRLIGCSCSQRS